MRLGSVYLLAGAVLLQSGLVIQPVRSVTGSDENPVAVVDVETGSYWPVATGAIERTGGKKFARVVLTSEVAQLLGGRIGLVTDRGTYLTNWRLESEREGHRQLRCPLSNQPQLGVGYTAKELVLKLRQLTSQPTGSIIRVEPKRRLISGRLVKLQQDSKRVWSVTIELDGPPPPWLDPKAPRPVLLEWQITQLSP